ncbi:hypothetical protein [Polaribacter glomeratus]|uniref:Uncharacterized protein n=1 Tax=Polaribacter glomeratus TaxID=102 RepID=A0A2S7WFQ9_9FLAO|nr:hypothetical protein [Polaribacter glomeratus]PQJ76450.1 hypothetical protein BTO16_11100 [Polaribacter glomeratus]TXD65584.1 hypothetical protein ESX12_10405 [Polaribacter glomeratus]
MRNILKLLLSLFILSSINTYSQSKKQIAEEKLSKIFEIKCEGVGTEGIYLIKVFSYSKDRFLAVEQAKMNAIRGVIFRGIPPGERGCVAQPAMVRDSNLEEQSNEYFKSFFAIGGKYSKFIDLTTEGAVKAEDRFVMKGKAFGLRGKVYKIGVVVSVNKNLLRKELEDAGIIKKLSSGF